jgi:uncharacterized tellurite resistance protein B-like protein
MFTKLLEILELKESVDQKKSEAIISLTTLLYQADGKVKLEEQDMFEKLVEELPWENSFISKEAFHREMVAASLAALKANKLADYLQGIVPALKSDPQVLALLRELAVSDGNLDQKEAEILTTVSNLMV